MGWAGSPELADPADRVTLDESVSYALMVVLETLTPAERTAWVLHDLFGVPFPEVAGVVGRDPAAVHKLAARARAHVRTGRPGWRSALPTTSSPWTRSSGRRPAVTSRAWWRSWIRTSC